MKTNIYRIQASDSIMRGYFCIGFIGFMLKGRRSVHQTDLISLSEKE